MVEGEGTVANLTLEPKVLIREMQAAYPALSAQHDSESRIVDAKVSFRQSYSCGMWLFSLPLYKLLPAPSSLPPALRFATLSPLSVLPELCLPLQKNIIPASFHDGLLLYVQAVTETLAQGGTVTDGEDITRRMWNRSFRGQGLELSGMGCFGAGGEHEPQVTTSGDHKKLVTQ